MKIANLGEDRVVREIVAQFQGGKKIPLDIGDDCAAVHPVKPGWLQLLKTDAMAEGVHFLRDSPAHLVGRKALARLVSDIAAMGGVPEYALLTVALPPEFSLTRARAMARGMGTLAKEYHIKVAGGETIRSPGALFVSVMLTGRVERKNLLTRCGGRAGDLLFVTGVLGGSIKGHHFRFTPRLAEAQWLVANYKPSAMLDLSDGLASDLPRLSAASGVGFSLETERLPRRKGSSVEGALKDGEDYELLFSIPPRRAAGLLEDWQRAFPRTPLTCIGRLTKKEKMTLSGGFDHFKE